MRKANKINVFFGFLAKKMYKKKNWVILNDEVFNKYFESAETDSFFLCNLHGPRGIFLERVIRWFEQGFSHTVPLFYGDITKHLNSVQIEKVKLSLRKVYKNPPVLKKVRVWVVGSADEIGLNWFDFSMYQDGLFKVYAPWKVDPATIKKMLSFGVSLLWIRYDLSGLLMKFLGKLKIKIKSLNDSFAVFCSEYTQLFFSEGGIKVSEESSTGPGAIDKYLEEQSP